MLRTSLWPGTLGVVFLTVLAGTNCLQAATPNANGVEFFEKKIRPVLVEQCYQCHSAAAQKAGKLRGQLYLDSRAGVLKGGENGAILVPGKPKNSRLLGLLRHEDEPKMPPKKRLAAPVVADFVKWIEMGAPDPRAGSATVVQDNNAGRDFWSFQAPKKAALPAVQNTAWPKNAVDRFILARLETEGLHPVKAAGKRELIRRATFDLTGLPPTPEEVETFLKDQSPTAFEKAIDRLLASPRYGERWGRYWLDVARYAEDQAHTFAVKPNSNAWRYRDWVINAFNEDLPYDRFVKLQIAADLLAKDDAERIKQLPALGFFGLGAQYYKNTDAARATADELDDRVDTLTRGFLGLTVACARCHDHKFDPIPTQDYYSLAGVFISSRLADVPLAPKEEVQHQQEESHRRMKDAEENVKAFLREEKTALGTGTDEETKAKLTGEKKKQWEKLQKTVENVRNSKSSLPMAHGLTEGSPMDMKVYLRGNPATPGEVAPRRFLRVLSGDTRPLFSHGSGRLDLADAIANKDNPLTARVLVNRLWQHHFGKGLVGTPSNFGKLGERPTHPELLDYLACRFVELNWSVKALHREIMLSATYQLGSERDEQDFAKDGDNKYLWRMNRRRLDVEALRDSLLAVSGKLDPTLGGPTLDLNSSGNLRRTVYGKISRHELNGFLRLFDFPDANISSEKRTETTVPQQQLFVLNSPFVIEQSKALAARVQKEATTEEGRLQRAFWLVYGRAASAGEVQLFERFLAAQDPPAERDQIKLTRWERVAQVLLASNEFLYVD